MRVVHLQLLSSVAVASLVFSGMQFGERAAAQAGSGAPQPVELNKLLAKDFLHPGRVDAVAFSPDNKSLVTACAVKHPDDPFDQKQWSELTLRDAATGKVIWRYELLNARLTALAFSPDGKTLAAASSGGKVLVLDLQTRQLRWFGTDEDSHVRSVTFSPDSAKLATGYNHLYVWDVPSGKLDHKLAGGGYITQAAWSPDGKTLVGCCPQYLQVRLWDMPSGKLQREIKTTEYANTMAFLPGGKNIFCGGSRYDIIDQELAFKFWRTGSGPLPFKREEAFKVVGTLTVRDLKTWQAAVKIDLLEFDIGTTSLSADGKRLAIAGQTTLGKETRKAMVYDLNTGKLLFTYTDPQKSKLLWKHSGAALSPDGTRLAFIGDGNAAKVWTLPAAQK